jgi:N-acetyl-anhydromuramyl-L-alanine amidase AmpD
MIGYDLIIDGDYGLRTVRSVKAFQKKYRLEVDGIVGSKTYQALKAAQKRTSKEEKGLGLPKNYEDLNVDTSVVLQEGQYIKQVHPKSQIYIHFTAGSSDAANVIKYWGSNEPRIATAYVIGGNGRIHEAFNPDFWSFHLGIKGSKGKLDRISIGIELCAYGGLKKKGNKFYAWPGDFSKEISQDEVYELQEEFRGFKYFHKYTDAQIESIEKLLDYLVIEYGIEVQDCFDQDWVNYNADVVSNKLPGIWTHTNVRKDKSDSYPDHRLIEVLNKVGK